MSNDPWGQCERSYNAAAPKGPAFECLKLLRRGLTFLVRARSVVRLLGVLHVAGAVRHDPAGEPADGRPKKQLSTR